MHRIGESKRVESQQGQCRGWLVLVLLCLLAACENKSGQSDPGSAIPLPPWVGDSVYLDTSNHHSTDKAMLGRYLFYDRRLSLNQTKSCASCHAPAFSFTDSYRRSIGALGDNVQYNAPPLVNLVYNKYLTWADSSLHYPEQQIRNPMFHSNPVELGWEGHEAGILHRIQNDSLYQRSFALVYRGELNPFTTKHVQECISCFVRTIVSLNAPYDRFLHTGDSSLLEPEVKSGAKLFYSAAYGCSGCHNGINFNHGAAGWYAGAANDSQFLRIPTLRNLRFTAPYLHDGSANTLDEVLDIHVNRPASISTNSRSALLTPGQRTDLLMFLYSLSDSSVLVNPAYANPFRFDETRPMTAPDRQP